MKWTEIKKPILMLAPMAGYSDSAYRQICKANGATLLMTELVSADAVAHLVGKIKNQKSKIKNKELLLKNATYKLMHFEKSEMPVIVQLFGKNPENFAVAAKWIQDNLKPAGIDINMGCPAKKVVKSDHGATLLRDQDRGVEVVKAVREAIEIPLSVKTRLGWESDDEILEFAPKLIEAGVDALIIHGRTYKDGFSGESRWENIYKIKSQNSKVKIIGNGDIRKYEDIILRMKNLDGVAIGRGAIGNPFIFNKKFLALSDSKKIEIKKKMALTHAELLFRTKGDHGIIEMRKHLVFYFRGLPNAKELRNEFVKVKNINDVKSAILSVRS